MCPEYLGNLPLTITGYHGGKVFFLIFGGSHGSHGLSRFYPVLFCTPLVLPKATAQLYAFVAATAGTGGRYSHSSGSHRWSIRNITAKRFLVHSHCSLPVPQTVTRCDSVSGKLHPGHWFVCARRIACSRSFVGNMSWITLYHTTFVTSSTGIAHTFVHTLCQFVPFHFFSTLISLPFGVSCKRVIKLPFVSLLYIFLCSSGLRRVTYADCKTVFLDSQNDSASCLCGGGGEISTRVKKIPIFKLDCRLLSFLPTQLFQPAHF
jgi:hypothetical protein